MLLDNGRLLLTGHHELESVKISEGSTLGLGIQLLAPGGLLPSCHNLISGPGLLQGLGAGVTGDLHLEVGEGDALEGDDLPDHIRVGAVHQDLGKGGREGGKEGRKGC